MIFEKLMQCGPFR